MLGRACFLAHEPSKTFLAPVGFRRASDMVTHGHGPSSVGCTSDASSPHDIDFRHRSLDECRHIATITPRSSVRLGDVNVIGVLIRARGIREAMDQRRTGGRLRKQEGWERTGLDRNCGRGTRRQRGSPARSRTSNFWWRVSMNQSSLTPQSRDTERTLLRKRVRRAFADSQHFFEHDDPARPRSIRPSRDHLATLGPSTIASGGWGTTS